MTKSSIALRLGQRLLSIAVVVPVAVATGFGTVVFLDEVISHGKSWQMPTIFLTAFTAAILASVVFMRAIGLSGFTTPSTRTKQPLDADN